MRSKKSNSTRGKGTRGSRGHGQDGSKKQTDDMKQLKKYSKTGGKTGGKKKVWVPDPDSKQRASFPSDFSSLRKDVTDNFCYRIPRLVLGPDGEDVPMPRQALKKKKEKEGRINRTIPEAYTVVVPGQPDIDAGVDGWIIPANTNDFVIRGNRMDALLETFSRVTSEKTSEKIVVTNEKGERVEVGRTPRVKNWWAESSKLEEQGSGGVVRVKTNATTVSMRDTVGVSPHISRALQRMIEDGFVEEARQAAEATMEPFGRVYEDVFRGPKTNAKVTSMVGHAKLLEELPEGHFHYDTWINNTVLTVAKTGINRDVVPARVWDAKATCHFGPGPGVTFWTRHLDVLGDLEELGKTEPEAAERAGYTQMLCDQALAFCKKRSEEAYEKALAEKAEVEADGGTFTDWIRPAEDYARDIRIHRELDRILAKAIGDLGLEKDYVAIGRAEYREHLIEAYKGGTTGIRMDTPEDLEQVKKVAERAELRAREATEANEKILMAIKFEREVVEQARKEAEALVAGVDADKAALKKALADAEEAKQVAEAARDVAIKAAEKEAAPILRAARNAEERIPAKEFSMQKAVFERIFKRKPKCKNRADLLALLDSSADTVRAEALAAANKELGPVRKDLEIREAKIGELERKAGLWDRVAPLLDRLVGALTGDTKDLVANALSNVSEKPDAAIKGWAAMLARVSQIVSSSKKKNLEPEKKDVPPV